MKSKILFIEHIITKKLINYKYYNSYKVYNKYKMEKKTTIAISNKVKETINEYGKKGESYSEIISRLLKSAKKRQLQDLLMDEKNTVPVGEALEKAKKKYSD